MELDAPSLASRKITDRLFVCQDMPLRNRFAQFGSIRQFACETMKNSAERNLYRAQSKLCSFHSAIGDILRRRAKFTQPVTGI